MATKIIRDLHMTVDSRSYIDAMHAVLIHAGWTVHPKADLSGMTVTGFRLVVHRRLTSESATAYNWMAENFLAADFLGVTASQAAGFSFHPTFPLYREQAISDLKAAIERGVGAIFWKDGFVIAAGYDDQAETLYYDDGSGRGLQSLSYGEFGQNRSPYWYYQVFEDKIGLDPIEVYKESLMQAIYKWEMHDLMLPEAEYACGSKAYEAIKQALSTGEFDAVQAGEVFQCYACAKRDISEYMDKLHSLWPQLRLAAAAYGRTAALFHDALDVVSAAGMDGWLKQGVRQELVRLFDEAQRSEQEGIDCIKEFMHERIGNRFEHVGLR
ncbi:hypothetical protein [Paenibacillus sp.]|uniref:hypothetical protein n=1 Tax=Paenibacillus sp. TaxID=58172 RepID=UPI00282755FD|nr:hypothetical protein [Paenibacillus sp.]MDR0268576.1 hypothetical protein [Paenibacillus sp.]